MAFKQLEESDKSSLISNYDFSFKRIESARSKNLFPINGVSMGVSFYV